MLQSTLSGHFNFTTTTLTPQKLDVLMAAQLESISRLELHQLRLLSILKAAAGVKGSHQIKS
jgi:hypothetical protein